jgi:hypothetical protein
MTRPHVGKLQMLFSACAITVMTDYFLGKHTLSDNCPERVKSQQTPFAMALYQ